MADLELLLELDQLNGERAVYVLRDNGDRASLTISRAMYDEHGRRARLPVTLRASELEQVG
jgi:hypothetical protein